MLRKFALFLRNIRNTIEAFLILKFKVNTSFTHPDHIAGDLLSFGPIRSCSLLFKYLHIFPPVDRKIQETKPVTYIYQPSPMNPNQGILNQIACPITVHRTWTYFNRFSFDPFNIPMKPREGKRGLQGLHSLLEQNHKEWDRLAYWFTSKPGSGFSWGRISSKHDIQMGECPYAKRTMY